MKKITIYALSAACLLMGSITSCKKQSMTPEDALNPQPVATTEEKLTRGGADWKNSGMEFYALANGNRLDKFKSNYCYNNNPSPINSATITGLQPNETILAIDFRPATGQLYGLGSGSRIYVINPMAGAARMIGMNAITPALSGSISAFDFNPTVDRIRIVTSTGQNLRVHPETGAVAATDGSINGAAAAITSVAYTNNYAGATTTVLYDIDPATDKLYKQDPPNAGTLTPVGDLTMNVEGEGGFDISPAGAALAIYQVGNVSKLLELNLTTGKAEVRASFPSATYTALAIPTASVAYAATSANNLLIFGLESSCAYAGLGANLNIGLPGLQLGLGLNLGLGGNNNNAITAISKPITGLGVGETILGIDMRPLNGQLYALGSNNNIYIISTATGAATLAYTLSTALTGTQIGFDFNPMVDRIRIVSNTGENRRFNPNDGSLTIDGNLNPGSPAIASAAYSNNFAGTATTVLFGIDYNNDKLYQINPPNGGTLSYVGNLGVNLPAENGFDIGGSSNKAYTLFKSGNNAKLYRINTTNGSMTQCGSLGNVFIRGFAVGLGF